MKSFTKSELEAYLDEALPLAAMAQVEQALRQDAKLLERLAEVSSRRDAGVHSLGEIWRRHRLSCPPREHLGNYLLGVLDDAVAAYLAFHLDTAGCRICQANLEDLRKQQVEESTATDNRRRRYFQSSAGHLRKK